jgi:hypothetical protein
MHQLEFKRRQFIFSAIKLGLESPPPDMTCAKKHEGICGGTTKWRCRECFGNPFVCQYCLLLDHHNHPFHIIDVWDPKKLLFRRSTLQQAGLVVHFGHGGLACPEVARGTPILDGRSRIVNDRLYGAVPGQFPHSAQEHSSHSNPLTNEDSPYISLPTPDDPTDDDEDEWEDMLPSSAQAPGPSVPGIAVDEFLNRQNSTDRAIIVGHTNGFHQITARFCHCSSACAEWRQMLGLQLWPATLRRPQTAFTVDCLRDLQYHNVVCKTSVNSYHTQMQNKTFRGLTVRFPVS